MKGWDEPRKGARFDRFGGWRFGRWVVWIGLVVEGVRVAPMLLLRLPSEEVERGCEGVGQFAEL